MTSTESMRRRLGRWLRGQKIFICVECGKRWPRDTIWGETCGGTHGQHHPHRFMKRARQYRRENPTEMAAHAMRWPDDQR
jgi:hypothetical protein